MNKDTQKLGGMTDLMDVTTSSAVKALTVSNSLYVIIDNLSSTNDVFVNSGTSADTVVMPTTSTGQRGAYIAAGVKQVRYKKNSPNDTHIIAIGAGSATIAIQAADGE